MTNVTMSNSVYDKLKTATTQWIPAAGSAYFGLSQIWGWPAGEEVVGSLAIVATFLGVLLGLSSRQYEEQHDGDVVVERDPATGKVVYGLEYDGDVGEIADKDRVVFHVKDKDQPFWEG